MPGERTIAIDQQAKLKDPKLGYDPLLAARMEVVLPVCRKNKVKIITNCCSRVRLGNGRLGHAGTGPYAMPNIGP